MLRTEAHTGQSVPYKLPWPHLKETRSKTCPVRGRNTPQPRLRFSIPPTTVLFWGLPSAQGVDARSGEPAGWQVRVKLSMTGEERQGLVGVARTTQSGTLGRVSSAAVSNEEF